MNRKLILTILVPLLIIGVFFFLRFIVGGSEDDWICVNNQWVKHGNPKDSAPTGSCGEKKKETEKTGIANPASVYCEEQGGKLEIRKAEDGSEAGWCVFSDSKECDEWQFFRSKVCE